jgi:hypothetical protein
MDVYDLPPPFKNMTWKQPSYITWLHMIHYHCGELWINWKKKLINVSCKHEKIYHQHPQQKWHCGHSMANWYTFLFGPHFFYGNLFKRGYVILKLFGGINIGLLWYFN